MWDVIPMNLNGSPLVLAVNEHIAASCGTKFIMNIQTKSNNARLRELVEQSGLTQPAALAKFNQGLGAAAYSNDAFKAFLSAEDSKRFRRLKDVLLVHAEEVFSSI